MLSQQEVFWAGMAWYRFGFPLNVLLSFELCSCAQSCLLRHSAVIKREKCEHTRQTVSCFSVSVAVLFAPTDSSCSCSLQQSQSINRSKAASHSASVSHPVHELIPSLIIALLISQQLLFGCSTLTWYFAWSMSHLSVFQWPFRVELLWWRATCLGYGWGCSFCCYCFFCRCSAIDFVTHSFSGGTCLRLSTLFRGINQAKLVICFNELLALTLVWCESAVVGNWCGLSFATLRCSRPTK